MRLTPLICLEWTIMAETDCLNIVIRKEFEKF